MTHKMEIRNEFFKRLQKVVDKSIGIEQSAYIKERFIGNNARKILDVYEYCMEQN